ncbi:hypothetical protein B484DRAFT_451745 [Ochromonadaceae sp. CCMP2298]|nr:hypothetical protein B484DRAFT_451745 [Ochromonadaceae sp. CCMP2298]|mmetsp:Transcript_14803/g.32676  ORF Transcript_14803/g.32676 Transcript_14803/m.32676 type:complete len:386 (+) Transcript_14803:156-1313(+)|eukprot:CAMPEP_0173173916 /NCGR_PEP_ID=MMETSP1141-20130122/3080_1 /TAXON_ID=483371 /ORGANISM="non described non described, Strain CCMP2298" /LENGTH=385 /DNA_ID=CAMNT_0014096017 /DNA_START=158 /DNA_END=1315 /DNA_ORIENTATION=-
MNNEYNADSSDDFDNEYVYSEEFVADLKFRSIKVDEQGGDFFYQPASHVDFGQAFAKSAVKSSSGSGSDCPSVPFGIARTNFPVEKSDYGSVVQAIHDTLLAQEDHDFSFVDHEHMWRGKYLQGSCCFEMDVNLYHDSAANNFIVAVRKVKCDSGLTGAFNKFYRELKTALGTPQPAPPKGPCFPSRCPGASAVTDKDFLDGVKSVFRMAYCLLENRVQAAKMMFDISQKDAHFLELPGFSVEAVKVLEALVSDEAEDVRQHAVMAVAAFVELASYKEAFMRSSMLSVLFGLVENCPDSLQAYESAQVRRTAAAIMAVLSRTHPYTVRSELHSQACDVAAWLRRANCLQDSRTREAAMTIKESLEDVAVMAPDHDDFGDLASLIR